MNLKIFRFQLKGKLILISIIISLLNASLFSVLLNVGNSTSQNNQNLNVGERPSLVRFSSYEELKEYLNKCLSCSWFPRDIEVLPKIPMVSMLTTAEVKSMGRDYSRTNIQVEGVDEDDFVKTDGEYIYLAFGRHILIVKAYPPDEVKLSADICVDGTVSSIFISGKRLVVISRDIYRCVGDDCKGRDIFLSVEPIVSILIYDVKTVEIPVLVRNVTVRGTYFSSRMIEDYIYVLVSSPIRFKDKEPILPEIADNGRVIKIEPTSIYHTYKPDPYNAFTMIIAVNVRNTEESVVCETFLFGLSNCVYVSLNNVYVTVLRYSEAHEITEIHRISIGGGRIRYEASGSIPGFILDQFSMDEYNGYFRIATTITQYEFTDVSSKTTVSRSSIFNNIYVLDMNLSVIGSIEGLAPDEYLYSARFIGNRCYLVTFKKVDPLFVISLEDPTRPKILGKLKIPGYSDYLHPYDENHLIGIGKWTIEAEEGDFAWYQGVKISLFDVSDVKHPKEVDSIVIGDRGTDSPVLHDHKALLFDRDLNLLAIPILVAEIDEAKYPNGVPPNTYGDYVWQGVYVFNITESRITLRGRITHIKDLDDLLKSGYHFQSDYSIKRTLYIGNILYTISNRMIKMNDLETLEEVYSLDLSMKF